MRFPLSIVVLSLAVFSIFAACQTPAPAEADPKQELPIERRLRVAT